MNQRSGRGIGEKGKSFELYRVTNIAGGRKVRGERVRGGRRNVSGGLALVVLTNGKVRGRKWVTSEGKRKARRGKNRSAWKKLGEWRARTNRSGEKGQKRENEQGKENRVVASE